MSLAHSKGDPKGQGKEGWELLSSKKSEKTARCLSQPSHAEDSAPYTIHANGNTKPQEPPHLLRRRSGIKLQPRLASHIHAKPWSLCHAPGRKENPHHVNPHHRVWIADAGRVGRVFDGTDDHGDMSLPRRWTKDRKNEHYKQYELELNALRPHDELFAIKTNVKFWTHLQNRGVTAGGQEKLEYVPPRIPGYTKLHGSIYLGKFSNIKHAQMILKSGHRNEKHELEEWQVDTRAPFDNRLHDDVVRRNDINDQLLAQSSYQFFRPVNTRSCPQMGVDYMQR